jgi:hypothetical protein
MTDLELAVLLKALLFGVIVGVGSMSFLMTLLLGPAREYVKSGIALIDDEDLEFTTVGGRKLRRPNRNDLRDPAKVPGALKSYRERAKRSISSSRARFDVVFQKSLNRAFVLVFVTLGASTFAFISFIAANNYLFGKGEAVSGTQVELVQAFAFMIVAHFKSAFGFTLSGLEGSALKLGGYFTDTASNAYKLVVTWAAPVLTHQMKWLFYDLDLLWKDSIRDLQRIEKSSDADLLKELEDYIAEKKTASSDGWISSLWHRAWGHEPVAIRQSDDDMKEPQERDGQQELREAA